MSIENRKKEACSRGTSSMGTELIDPPSTAIGGCLLAIGGCLLESCCFWVVCVWCEGTWLDCFLWVGDDMNVYRGYTKPHSCGQEGELWL
jgi:hypothetical protein